MSGCMAWTAQSGAGRLRFDVVSLFTAYLPPWCERSAWAQVSSSAATSGERTMVLSRTNASWLSSMLSWS